jgi:non-specific serine/threonine protein kinase
MLHRGRLAYVRGDVADALALTCESLRAYQRLGVRRDVAGCLDLVALICAPYDPTRAARLFGAANAVRRSLSAALPPVDARARSAAVARVRTTLGTEFEAQLDAGAALPLEAAIEEALATQPPVSQPVYEPSTGTGPLSQREREVAELIAEGLSNREIAERLVIAPRTAEAHVTHVLTKLGLRSRSQVAVWVVNQSKPR